MLRRFFQPTSLSLTFTFRRFMNTTNTTNTKNILDRIRNRTNISEELINKPKFKFLPILKKGFKMIGGCCVIYYINTNLEMAYHLFNELNKAQNPITYIRIYQPIRRHFDMIFMTNFAIIMIEINKLHNKLIKDLIKNEYMIVGPILKTFEFKTSYKTINEKNRKAIYDLFGKLFENNCLETLVLFNNRFDIVSRFLFMYLLHNYIDYYYNKDTHLKNPLTKYHEEQKNIVSDKSIVSDINDFKSYDIFKNNPELANLAYIILCDFIINNTIIKKNENTIIIRDNYGSSFIFTRDPTNVNDHMSNLYFAMINELITILESKKLF
jgi:hypothetical protein